MKHSKLILNSFLSMTMIAFTYSAQAEMGEMHHGPPPQVALDACNGKTEGAECSFTGRMNDMLKGTCHPGPQGQGPLACRPAINHQGGQPGMGAHGQQPPSGDQPVAPGNANSAQQPMQ